MNIDVLFLQYRISMIFLLAFQLLFLPLRYKKWKSGLIVLGCYVVTGVMEYLIFYGGVSMAVELLLTVLEIIVVQFTACLLCCYRDFRALFTGISSATYVLLGNMISIELSVVLPTAWWALVVEVAVHSLLLVLLVIFLRWNYLNELECSSVSWAKLCVVPALFYAVTYILACWPGRIYEIQANWWGIFFLLLLMDITYVLLIKLVSQQRIESELEKSNAFLETYAWGLHREAEALYQAEEKIRVLRHDSKYIYRMIGGYLEAGELDQIKKLLNQMEVEIQNVSPKRFCQNLTINGILDNCATNAKKEQIAFSCKADVPEDLKNINEFEWATVASNLLSNALEAAAQVKEVEERKVSVRIFSRKNQLMLEIKNTFGGKCEFFKVTGLPLSKRGNGHGYGLLSVKAYAAKNGAVFHYSIEEGLFCVWLLANM